MGLFLFLFFLAKIAGSRGAAWALAVRPFSKATLLYRFLFFCFFRNKNDRLPFTFFETEDVLKMIRCWLRKLIFEQGAIGACSACLCYNDS